MDILRKAGRALDSLRKNGPIGLGRDLWRYAVDHVAPVAPDESQIVFEVMKSIRGERVMFDVGAHRGYVLGPFARSGWHVIAFEPDANNRAHLEEAFGGADNVEIEGIAVSNQTQKGVPFFTSDVSDGISSLMSFHESHVQAACVDTVALRDFVEERGVKAIDFLKIDVEGLDFLVLQGCPWERLAPRVILAEFEDEKTCHVGYTFHDMSRFLLDRGYRVMVSEWFPIVQYGTVHKWRRFTQYPCELVDSRAWGNVIAVRDDALWRHTMRACARFESRARLGAWLRRSRARQDGVSDG